MKKVYLAGPISNDPDPLSWRQECRRLFPAEYWKVCNPLDIEVNIDDPIALTEADLRIISTCQVVLAKVDNPSWGTAMELFYASQLHIPAVGWLSDMSAERSPWLIRHICQFESTLEFAVRTARQVART